MMSKSAWLVLLFGLLGILLLDGSWAESQSALDPSLEQAIANHKKTAGEAQQYAYTELKKDRAFDSKGKLKQDSSDSFEIIFLEGAPYQKHTLHNGQPLPEKEQKAEDKKLADVAKARRESKDKAGLFSGQFHLQLPVDEIPTRFDVTAAGSDEIDGRKMLKFNAVPRIGTGSVKEIVRDGLAYEMKLWVDEQDKVFAKIEARVIADGMRYENGSLLGYNWEKVNGEVWLPDRYWFKGKVRYMMMDVSAETDQSYSDYKKFRAETKIVTE